MLFAWLIGCAPHRFPGPLSGLGREPAVERALAAAGASSAVADAAAAFVGSRELRVDGEAFRRDCSGLVEAATASAGCSVRGSSAMLFDQARERGVLHRRRVPAAGDVAFFDDTYDRNGNGRTDDPLSHVAIVESVDPDGTIHLVHIGSAGVVRIVMNLRHPEDRDDRDGKRINDYLRSPGRNDSPRTRRLSGELWVAFGSFWKADQLARSTR